MAAARSCFRTVRWRAARRCRSNLGAWGSSRSSAAMPSGPSDYLAAERTFLAWIRTGLALMGFGFVVARFGLFLRALQFGNPAMQAPAYGLSFWFGTALIVLGVIVNGWSARHPVRLVQDLNQGGSAFNRSEERRVG